MNNELTSNYLPIIQKTKKYRENKNKKLQKIELNKHIDKLLNQIKNNEISIKRLILLFNVDYSIYTYEKCVNIDKIKYLKKSYFDKFKYFKIELKKEHESKKCIVDKTFYEYLEKNDLYQNKYRFDNNINFDNFKNFKKFINQLLKLVDQNKLKLSFNGEI